MWYDSSAYALLHVRGVCVRMRDQAGYANGTGYLQVWFVGALPNSHCDVLG